MHWLKVKKASGDVKFRVIMGIRLEKNHVYNQNQEC
jgi:hypothetical protein